MKYIDLQDFYVRMVIVADEKRRQEYLNKLSYSAFDTLRNNERVAFLSYESLDKQYEQELLKQQFDFII